MKRAMMALMGLFMLSPLANLQARGLDISVSAESAQLMYLHQSEAMSQNGAELGFGYLYNDKDGSMASLRLLTIGQKARYGSPFQIGVGAKGMFGQTEDEDADIGGVGVGGRLAYVVPSSVSPVGFVAELFYAPGILAFGDADAITDFNARVEIDIRSNQAQAYVGYRLIKVELDNDTDVEVDDNVHVGFRIAF